MTPHGWRQRRAAALDAGILELTGGKPVPDQVRERMWQALGLVFSAGAAAGPCPGRAARSSSDEKACPQGPGAAAPAKPASLVHPSATVAEGTYTQSERA